MKTKEDPLQHYKNHEFSYLPMFSYLLMPFSIPFTSHITSFFYITSFSISCFTSQKLLKSFTPKLLLTQFSFHFITYFNIHVRQLFSDALILSLLIRISSNCISPTSGHVSCLSPPRMTSTKGLFLEDTFLMRHTVFYSGGFT